MENELLQKLESFIGIINNSNANSEDEKAILYCYIEKSVGYFLRTAATLDDIGLINDGDVSIRVKELFNVACNKMYDLTSIDDLYIWLMIDLLDARKYYLFPSRC